MSVDISLESEHQEIALASPKPSEKVAPSTPTHNRKQPSTLRRLRLVVVAVFTTIFAMVGAYNQLGFPTVAQLINKVTPPAPALTTLAATITNPPRGSLVSQCQLVDVSFNSPPPTNMDYWVIVSDGNGFNYVQHPLVRNPEFPGHPEDLVGPAWFGNSSTSSSVAFYINVVAIPPADSRSLRESDPKPIQIRRTWRILTTISVHRSPGGSRACPPV